MASEVKFVGGPMDGHAIAFDELQRISVGVLSFRVVIPDRWGKHTYEKQDDGKWWWVESVEWMSKA